MRLGHQGHLRVWLAVCSLLILTLGAWWAGARTQTRSEPEPAVDVAVTAPVERRILRDSFVVRGIVSATGVVDVRTPAPPQGADTIVTAAPILSGGQVAEGSVVVEVSGRPVFVLQGNVPMYRDLRVGSNGEDVAQLQRALSRIGLTTRDRAGVYGRSTAQAIEALYRKAGYEAPSEEVESTPASPGAQGEAPRGAVALRSALVFCNFPAWLRPPSPQVGQRPDGVLLTLMTGELAIRGIIGGKEPLISPGNVASIAPGGREPTFAGKVTAVNPEDSADENIPSWSVVVSSDNPIDGGLLGRQVVVTVETASTQSEVLVVPISAIFVGGDGKPYVTVVKANIRTKLAVQAGLSAGGYVEVTSTENSLQEGDQVAVSK